jgi:hypothetical protein
MPVGICKLCLEIKELQLSHLYPRALYSALRNEDGGNSNPVLLTQDTEVQKSGQIKDYLLCRECEQYFNRHGERWVTRFVFDGRTFRLRDILLNATPVEQTEDDKLIPYAGAEILHVNMDKLIFFGLSLFWRASVHKWTLLDTEIHLPLGPDEEPLRQCLLGQVCVPNNMAMSVMVAGKGIPPWQSFVAIGPSGEEGKPEKRYVIMLAGLNFMLVVNSPHYGDYQWSSTHSPRRYIFTSSTMELMNAFITTTTLLRQRGEDAAWDVKLVL